MLKVLVLASWYPNRTDAFGGDFVQRHVLATAPFAKMVVVFVTKDESLASGEQKVDISEEDGVVTYRAYYGRSSRFGLLEKFQSYRRFFRIQKQLIGEIEERHGRPDLVHVQIAMKAGLAALHLKKTYGLPYVVTENWSGYYPASSHNIYEKDRWFRRLNTKVLRHAALFLPVTEDLGKLVNQHFAQTPFRVVPNVVNTRDFFFRPSHRAVFRFFHASYLNYQKNPDGMIRAAAILKKRGYQFELFLLGNKDALLSKLVVELDLTDTVTIHPAVPYREVAIAMQEASAFLLFSRFENLPCVILEALCCGLPVVSSRVGGIAEVIDSSNGLLVSSGDEEGLANAMQQMIDQYHQYDRLAIANSARNKFSYEVVGKQYLDCYTEIMARK